MHTRVGILEDLAAHRTLLERAVRSIPQLHLSFSVGSLDAARAWLNPPPELLLLDLGLPDGHGEELLEQLTERTAVLVVTAFGDEHNVIRALERGARGYVLKDAGEEAIVEAINSVLSGGAPLTPSISAHLLKRFKPVPERVPEVQLTPRESEVLRMLARGFSYREAAEHLTMSVHTLGHHVKQIYGKLAVTSRSEAVFEAIHQGLIELNARP